MVVYIHGYYNCIRNIVRRPEDQCNCSAGGQIREGYDLIGQFERACKGRGSLCSSLFVAAEVAYDQANDSPGKWANEGMLKAFLDELLIEHMSAILNSSTNAVYDTSKVSRIRIFSHSGGYYTIGDMAIIGGMTAVVKDLVLFDSLYANFDKFDGFVQSHIYSFGYLYSQFRFSSLYTQSGGTYSNNQNMAARVKSMISMATAAGAVDPDPTDGGIALLLLDNSSSTSANSNSTVYTQIQNYTAIFKLATCSHDDVPRNYFYAFLMYAE